MTPQTDCDGTPVDVVNLQASTDHKDRSAAAPELWKQMVVDVVLELKRKQYTDFTLVVEDLQRLVDHSGVEDLSASLARVLLQHARHLDTAHAGLPTSSTEQPAPTNKCPRESSITEESLSDCLRRDWEPVSRAWEQGDMTTWPMVPREQDLPEACVVFRMEGGTGAFHSQASVVLGFYNRSPTKSLVVDYALRRCLIRPNELAPAMQDYPLWLAGLSKEFRPKVVRATHSDFEIVCGRLPTRRIEEAPPFSVSIGGQWFVYKDGKFLSSEAGCEKADEVVELPMRLERRFLKLSAEGSG